MLGLILDLELPLREELEVMLVKVALKPALHMIKKFGQPELSKQGSDLGGSSKSQGKEESDMENEDFIQIH